MYDQSFGASSLQALFRESDYKKYPHLLVTGQAVAAAAAREAHTLFAASNPLQALHVRRKQVFRASSFHNELILRKLTLNIRNACPNQSRGRRFVVETLISHLAEGLPYRLYKRDVHKFYPSFVHSELERVITNRNDLPWLTKRLLGKVLEGHALLHGTGLPVGLGLSAVLSELMMQDFDEKFKCHSDVRFYARYVDDIIIITSGEEFADDLSQQLASALPSGLRFNALKKTMQETDPITPTPSGAIEFTYLGYSIKVNPTTATQLKTTGREVVVDLSPGKIKKIKTRIVRTMRAYTLDQDFELLKKRVAFLTSNASLPVSGKSVRRLVGIYHTYPLITISSARALQELDRFIRALVLADSGRLSVKLQQLLNRQQRSQLLSLSFVDGYKKKRFVNVSRAQLAAIRKCWINE